jgi:hypothetical protein
MIRLSSARDRLCSGRPKIDCKQGAKKVKAIGKLIAEKIRWRGPMSRFVQSLAPVVLALAVGVTPAFAQGPHSRGSHATGSQARMGTVADFSPTNPPLALTPGRHSIEIRANGYRTMLFDPEIVAGQVLPYQGTMRLE